MIATNNDTSIPMVDAVVSAIVAPDNNGNQDNNT